MLFRSLVAKDIIHLLDIEQQSNPTPWSTEKFASTLKKFPSFVMQDDKVVVAVVVFQLVCEQADIIHVVRSHRVKNCQIGLKLLQKTLDEFKKKKIKSVFLEVRESNRVAKNCYEKLGFLEIGKRKNYYNNHESAICMKIAL